MPDKTALGISEELRQFIEALVEEVVLEGKNFEEHKKYLNRFCIGEGVNYNQIETNLTNLFETAEELKAHESKGSERLLRLLGKECYLTDDEIEKIISIINNKRSKIDKEHKAQEEAERKGDAERKTKEERERKAKEESERILRKERECKKEEAERKTYEEYKRKELEGLPFKEFPCIQQQLMTVVDKDKFDDYVFLYGRSLEEIRKLFDEISNYLADDDVKQSNEYSVYRLRSSNLMERAKNAQCNDIKSIEREGDELVNMGRQMGYRVRDNRKEIAYKKLVKKRTRIATLITVIAVLIACFYIGLIIEYPNYLKESSALIQIISGLIMGVDLFVLILLLPFLWSKDFRKKE